MTDHRVLNRHAIAHGIVPSRGAVLDTIKLIGVLDGLASIIGQVTDQQFGLFGKFHGARESSGGVCYEPGSSIEAVDVVFSAFHALSVSPVWVELVRRASETMDGIAKNGTIILFPPPPSVSEPAPPPTPPPPPGSDPAPPPLPSAEMSEHSGEDGAVSASTTTRTMAASTSER